MSDLKGRTIRLSEENWEWLDGLPGTMNEVITSLRSAPLPDSRVDELLELMRKADTRTSEILEHAQSQVSIEDVQELFDGFIQTAREAKAQSTTSDPGSIVGVQQGYAGLGKPRYESRADRDARERQEKMDKARARSSVGDDPAYSFEPEFVQD